MNEPLRVSVDGRTVADWIRRLQLLAYIDPKVSVYIDPDKAAVTAIRELQNELQTLVGDIAREFKGGRGVWCIDDVLADLDKPSPS